MLDTEASSRHLRQEFLVEFDLETDPEIQALNTDLLIYRLQLLHRKLISRQSYLAIQPFRAIHKRLCSRSTDISRRDHLMLPLRVLHISVVEEDRARHLEHEWGSGEEVFHELCWAEEGVTDREGADVGFDLAFGFESG